MAGEDTATPPSNGSGTSSKQTGPGYHNIVTLIKRLEAATSRLEDLAEYQEDSLQRQPAKAAQENATDTGNNDGASSTTSVSPFGSTSAPSTRPSGPSQSASAAASADTGSAEKAPAVSKDLPQQVSEFDAMIQANVEPFVRLSGEIDAQLGEAAKKVADAFHQDRLVVELFARCKAPHDLSSLEPFKKRVADDIQAVAHADQKLPRTTNLANHFAVLREGIPAAGWFSVAGGFPPGDYVQSIRESAEFYVNRVYKDFKQVDPKHLEWGRSFMNALKSLQIYVKKNHAKGINWNPNGQQSVNALASELVKDQGGDSKTAKAAPPPPPAPSGGAGGPPPPPPPPPPQSFYDDLSKNESAKPGTQSKGGLDAVFADLNRGSDVTAKLKKVDKSQMTHKNPELRSGNKPLPALKPKSLGRTASSSGTQMQPKAKKPARAELEGTKWIVENFHDNPEVVVEATGLNQGVFIDNCTNSTIQIKGKINAVTLSSSVKTGIVVDSLVAGAEIIKCKSFGIQVQGVSPTITLDQCDQGQIYLSSPESLKTEILTSQCSSINVNIPGPTQDGDFVEKPLPEQICTTIRDGLLVSTIVEHAG